MEVDSFSKSEKLELECSTVAIPHASKIIDDN